jgi:hypothetical protein
LAAAKFVGTSKFLLKVVEHDKFNFSLADSQEDTVAGRGFGSKAMQTLL